MDYTTLAEYGIEGYTFKVNADGARERFPITANAEADRVAQILPDLNTYCSELMTSLIMGEKSLANWNSYMADLKRLGLDDLMSIYQARMDRLSK
jgi:hypothetical protein